MNNSDQPNVAPALPLDAAPERAAPTILCVDDDPNISEAIARRLLRLGIRVLARMTACKVAGWQRPRNLT